MNSHTATTAATPTISPRIQWPLPKNNRAGRTATAPRGSRRKCRSCARTIAVLKTPFSPPVSIQTGVAWGAPSSRSVTTVPQFFPRKSSACFSVTLDTRLLLVRYRGVPPRLRTQPGASIDRVKVEAMEVEGRKVYTIRGFNNGVARWLNKLPTLWIEGEVTELRRQQRWASVFFTLKDPED